MSVATPTLIPSPQPFPLLLPRPPRPHPQPPGRGLRMRLAGRRDLNKELDQLSEEEAEIEEQIAAIRNRGFSFLVPLGRQMTLQEEKNDAASDSSEEGSEGTVGEASVVDDGENGASGVEADAEHDLDASMEDLDAEDGADDEDDEDEDEEAIVDASQASITSTGSV